MRLIICLVLLFMGASLAAQDFALHSFDRTQLTDVYYSEGIAAGDLNRDGHVDMVYGPYWFAGPDFKTKREIYPALAQPKDKYADHFFAWVHDFNSDGWNDVLTAGFPGKPGFVYENPQAASFDNPWPKHQILDSVSNESPHFTNLVGDAQPELVCTRGGYFGYAAINERKPFSPWEFHPISEKIAPVPFGHALGVGDVNNDGRQDILMKDGWFEQPAKLEDAATWTLHKHRFCNPGGAEMYAYDVDGDGDNDVITSIAAHDFGLVWHEQLKTDAGITFKQHTILGDEAAHNRYGILFSEPHSVNLADIDGDGLKDIVTGKTYWSHHMKSPLWNAGAVVYWFQLVRTKEGIDWVPHQADGEAGIGRQVIVQDINKDGLPDIASGGMKGAHVLLQRRERVSESRWRESQPKVVHPVVKPASLNQPPRLPPAPKATRIEGALEGESLKVLSLSAGKTSIQNMANFKAGQWSGNQQLFWSGAKPGDRLVLELTAPQAGAYDLHIALTKARDYAVVKILLDGQPLGPPLDLYNAPDVIHSGELPLGSHQLTTSPHRLTLEITGANPAAKNSHLLGLDYLRLAPH
jgi:hypothetical protein